MQSATVAKTFLIATCLFSLTGALLPASGVSETSQDSYDLRDRGHNGDASRVLAQGYRLREGNSSTRLSFFDTAGSRSRYRNSNGSGLSEEGTPISNPGFADMVIDELNEQVFVSGGPTSTWVDVFDFDGTLLTSIPSSGSTGMALDGTTLYVARSGSGLIDKIDTVSYSTLGSLDTAPHEDPRLLAFAGGRLWFTYAEAGCDPSCAGFGSVDPSDGVVTTYTGEGFPDITGAFATSPTDSSLLLVNGMDLSVGPKFYKYDISSGSPDLLLSRLIDDVRLGIFAVSRDGTKILFPGFSNPNIVRTLRVSDLSLTPVEYRASGHLPWKNPIRVAALDTTAANGGFLAAGGTVSPTPWKSVAMFSFGKRSPESLHATSRRGDICLRGLEFSADGQRLFAVSASSYKRTCDDGGLVFQVFEGLARFSSQVSLSARPSVVSYGRSVRLTGHLKQFAETSNDIVAILQKPLDGTKRLVKSDRVNAEGDFSATVSPKKRTSYFAEWSGDEMFLPARDADVVKVRVITTARLSSHYARDGRYKLFHARDHVVQTGRVKPNHSGKQLLFGAQVSVRGGWRTAAIESFRIGSDGHVTASFRGVQGHKYRVRNVFRGDRDHLGDSSPWLYLRVTR
jgi:hypothetical protein